jgi:ATP-binding cassette subfamily C protein CydC
MMNILQYIQKGKAYYPQMLLSVLLNVLTVGSSIALMSTSAYLITMAGFHPSIAELQVAIVGVRFFGISRGVFRYLERLVSHAVNFKILTGLRVWFFQKYEEAYPIDGLNLEQGDLVNRALDDIDTLENLYVRIIAPSVAAFLLAVSTSLVIGSFYTPSGWILFCGLTFSGLVVPALTYMIVNRRGSEIQTLKGKYRAQITRVVQAVEEILVFQQQTNTMKRLQETAIEIKKKEDRLDELSEGINLLNFLLLQATFILTLFAVIHGARTANLNPVLISVSGLMVLASFEATQSLGQAAVQLGKVNQAIRRLEQITDAPAHESAQAKTRIETIEQIHFSNVDFAYHNHNDQAVKNATLVLEKGKHLAIVGPSGGGKSTVLKLLQGFYYPKAGQVLINQEDIENVVLDSYRMHISAAGQDPFLFHQTLRKNLLLAKDGASDEELIEALNYAELGDWFMQLPNGLDAILQESAVNISAGEKQRLSIARASLKSAEIFVLDEPTANLDAEIEDRLMQKLILDQSHTLVWVTHRMKYLSSFDEILFILGGQIVERGKFTDLVKLNGAFAHYWQMQNEYLG